MRTALLSLLVMSFAPSPSSAQAFHLSPVPVPSYERGTPLLSITVADSASNPAQNHMLTSGVATSVTVVDGRLHILSSSGYESIAFGDRAISELITQLSAKYPNIGIRSDYPHLSTRLLGDRNTNPAGPIDIYGRSGTSVSASLGAGLTLNETRQTGTENRLLSNGGILLDLIGKGEISGHTARLRLGFRSGEALAVQGDQGTVSSGTEDSDGDAPPAPPPTPGTPLSSLVETSEVITLGGHLDTKPLLRLGEVSLTFGGEVSVTWAALNSYVMPDSIPIARGERGLLTEHVTATQITQVQRRLDQIRPLPTLLVGPRMIFGTGEDHSFYALLDAGVNFYPVQALRVHLPVAADPDRNRPGLPLRLSGVRESEGQLIWRLGAGMKFAGIIDLKMDASGPLGKRTDVLRERVPALLRVVLVTPDVAFRR